MYCACGALFLGTPHIYLYETDKVVLKSTRTAGKMITTFSVFLPSRSKIAAMPYLLVRSNDTISYALLSI